MTVRAISYGGGVQSTAMLILAARQIIPHRIALFANVGDDSENPATLDYLDRHARPYAERHGIELVSLRRYRRDGSSETLMQRLERDDRSIGIPVRMNTGAPGNRNCTADFKIRVIAKELKRRGATKDDPAEIALGISLDEYRRMRSDSGIPYETLSYPLIDLRMTRQDCINLIASEETLPIPERSSCFFCPFHTPHEWRDLLRNKPDLFAKSVELETMLNDRRRRLGKDPVWMTDALKPLGEAITENGQLDMFDGPSCTIGGYCHS